MASTGKGNDSVPQTVGGKTKGGGKESALSPSLVQRVAQGVRYAVSGVKPNDWFGPSQPIEPVAQEQAEGRVLDYPVGYNLRTQPREEEAISFQQLRGLADACNFLRLVIETRKDQMEKLGWNIQARVKAGMTQSEVKQLQKSDVRIPQIEQFFHRPDGRNNWATWLRQLIEELLVTDAVSIYRRPNAGGKLYGLQQVDGATIKRVIDESGLTPIAPDPAYQQILHGLPAVDYTADQLLYLPRNSRIHKLYGFSPVEQVVMTVNIALRRSVAQLNYFTEGNIPEALISCPPDWRPQQIHEMQEIFDGMLSGNLAARSGAKFVPGGLNVQFMKEALLKDDFDEWLVRIICYAFSVSPTPFTKQTNRATAESVQQAALQEGLAPLQNWVKGLIDRVLAEDFGSPDLEFVWNDERAMDPADAMKINTGYVAAAIKNRNEVRAELGLDPIPGGDEYTITAGNVVVRLEDALNPPEPAPAPPQLQGAAQTPPKPANDQEPEARPKAPKAKSLKKADGAEDSAESDQREDQLASILLAALEQQRDQLAAKVAGTEHTTADAGSAVEDAIASGAVDMDAVQPSVFAILEKSAAEATMAALSELPVDVTDPVILDPETAGAPHAVTASQPELTVAITNRGITSLVNEDAVEFAGNRSAEMIGRKLVDGKLVDNPDAQWAITHTTRNGIRDLVQKAEQEGQSVEQLARAIRESTLFSADRARRVAQWELGFSANNGNLIAWKRSGVVKGKRWLLGSEHMICDDCDSNLNAGVIGLDDAFPSGVPCPPAHVACPCSMAPVVNLPRTK